MTTAPHITTQRLTLRHHRIEDFEPMAALFATDWSRYMGGPITAEELWRWMGAEITSWQWLGFGSWAIELTKTGKLIGQVGINHPPQFPEVELGWCVFPEYEGKGYAFEAAMAAREWGFGPGGLTSLVSYIDPENDRSIALAERLGAKRDADALAPEQCDLVYRHPPADTDGTPEAYA